MLAQELPYALLSVGVSAWVVGDRRTATAARVFDAGRPPVQRGVEPVVGPRIQDVDDVATGPTRSERHHPACLRWCPLIELTEEHEQRRGTAVCGDVTASGIEGDQSAQLYVGIALRCGPCPEHCPAAVRPAHR